VSGRDEHDGAIEELLRRQFAAEELASTTSCLDEETVAAWVDDRLAPAERETAEIHVASCSRCQAILAAMVRMDPPAASAPAAIPLSRRWGGWFVRAAAAAAIAAVAVWAVVGRAPGPTQVAKMAPAETAERAPAAPPAATPQGAAGGISPGVRQEAAPSPVAEPSSKSRSSSQSETSGPPEADDQERRDLQESAARESAVAQDKAAANPEAPAQAPLLADQPEALRKMEPAVPPPAAAARTQNFSLGNAAPLAVVSSPDRASRWRLAGATVERSSDGVTWSPVYTGSVRLNAAAAPSSTVCWVAGERGTVLRSTDGRTFAPVTAPALLNLVSISASDARTASVVAADGRRFSTGDGGATWAAAP
jgi:hypothetical protein